MPRWKVFELNVVQKQAKRFRIFGFNFKGINSNKIEVLWRNL
jgi:hypothetical protein